MKLSSLLLLSLTASLAFAQQANQDENSTQWSPVTLAGEFLEHDYVNWFAYTDGVYDTYAPISNNKGVVTNNGSFGWEVGGGVSLSHRLRHGQFTLSYRGDYRDYQSSFYTAGTDQSLGLSFVKQFARKWSFAANAAGGISLYGGTIFATSSSGPTLVSSNPFSPETRFLSAGTSLTYQQSRRLSYVVSGGFFLQRYNFPGAIGSEGGSGSGSLFYRTTARTTIGATYSHSYYTFQQNAGTSNADTLQANVSHVFPNHWTASASGGFTHSSTQGTVLLPISYYGFTNLPGLYVEGQYKQSSVFPSFSGTVSRAYRHSTLFASGGEGLTPGNGYYLASKTLYLSGVYSIAIQRRQNVSFSGGYTRLSSVANAVAINYNSSSLTAAYGINLVRFFGVNARYDFIHYGSLSPNPSINDNRLSFGLTFSSKSVPLTLF